MRFGRVAAAVCGAVWLLAAPSAAVAKLSGPPPSYVLPCDDGRHLFVMHSPATLAEDEGKLATLPDGREVNLRTHFPNSGLYAIGSTTPLWSVDWFQDAKFVHLSNDGRYLVRASQVAGNSYFNPRCPSWALKFCDRGVEICSHDVSSMLDYHHLMPTDGWFICWYSDEYYDDRTDTDVGIHGTTYIARCSTREVHWFDIRTGERIRQTHFWKHVARSFYAGLGAALAACSLGLVHFLRWKRNRPSLPPPSKPSFRKWVARPTFSLRSLLGLTTVLAMIFAFARLNDDKFQSLAFLAFIVFVPACFTYHWVRSGRIRELHDLAGVSLFWIVPYVVSAGIVRRIAWEFNWKDDVYWAMYYGPYRPVTWAAETIQRLL